MKAYEKLKNEKYWTQGALARDNLDRLVSYESDKAVKWCAFGAILLCYKNYEAEDRVRARLVVLTGRDDIYAWNDAPGRTFEEVHQLLKECDA